jgi:hypothetical protein
MEGRLKIVAVIHSILEHAVCFVNVFTSQAAKNRLPFAQKPIYRRKKILYNVRWQLCGAAHSAERNK